MAEGFIFSKVVQIPTKNFPFGKYSRMKDITTAN
jgi:hypothetical protein